MERLLDIEKLSEMLGVKRATIYAWIYKKKIPYIKLGRLLRFKESEILDWITKQSVNPRLLNEARKKLKRAYSKTPIQTDYIDKIVTGVKEQVLYSKSSQN